MTWLVTGGAGYIGAHVLRALAAAGHEAVVLDDLSRGVAARVGDVPLVVGDLADIPLVTGLLREHDVDGVVHLAAAKSVEESVGEPLTYYRRNVLALVNLLDAMSRAGVDRIVYSSSAAVYGETTEPSVRETSPTLPASPYGETKLIGEWLVRAAGMRYAALRYFNVAGAGAPELGDTTTTNLVPLVLDAIEAGVPPRIFGDDYPTPDGTCVRDYVHVADVARAHVDVLEVLDGRTLNVGTGVGYSVREVVTTAGEVTGSSLPSEVVGRRPGDPPAVVADTSRIRAETPWRPQHDLRDMIRSAWEARGHG